MMPHRKCKNPKLRISHSLKQKYLCKILTILKIGLRISRRSPIFYLLKILGVSFYYFAVYLYIDIPSNILN